MQRAHRLRHAADFQRVRDQRRSWRHPLLVLYVAPNDGQETRLGISVGRRVGKAWYKSGEAACPLKPFATRHAELLPGPIWSSLPVRRPPRCLARSPDATEELLRRARVLPSRGAAVGSGTGRSASSRPACRPMPEPGR